MITALMEESTLNTLEVIARHSIFTKITEATTPITLQLCQLEVILQFLSKEHTLSFDLMGLGYCPVNHLMLS